MTTEIVAAAIAAAQRQEAVGGDVALEESVELVFNELRQVASSNVFGLCEEGRRVLLNKAVKRGLLWAVAIVVNRGAIGPPAGLPADGFLQARLAEW